MHDVSHRNSYLQRRARILEAAGYPGPIGTGLIDEVEKTWCVAAAAEQRRLLR